MAVGQSLGLRAFSQPGSPAARAQDCQAEFLQALSDYDLFEMWLNATDQEHPTVAEAAVRDELARREIEV